MGVRLCVTEEVAACLYQFKHLRPCQEQNRVPELIDLVKLFVEVGTNGFRAGPSASTDPSALVPEDLASLSAACDFICSSANVAWYPTFGCSLVAFKPQDDLGVDLLLDQDHLALHLVALDDWTFGMHSSSNSISHTSTSSGHSSLYCGTIPAIIFHEVVTLVAYLTNKRQDEKPYDNKKGSQRTPAFISAVVTDAITLLEAGVTAGNVTLRANQALVQNTVTMPRGGFTDVGLHTGGVPRHTSWPLVQQTLKFVLQQAGFCKPAQQPQYILQVALAHLDLWLLSQQLLLLQPATATADMLTACMVMLDSAAQKAAVLAIDGHNVRRLERAISASRQKIDAAANERGRQEAQHFMLPEVSCRQCASIDSPLCTWQLPRGAIPHVARAQRSGAETVAAQSAAAAAALGALPAAAKSVMGCQSGAQDEFDPDADLCSQLQQLLQLLQVLLPLSGDIAAQHAMRSVEHVLFECAATGFQCSSSRLQSAVGVQTLQQLVFAYRDVAAQYRTTAAASANMTVELRSREILVTWVAYCMTFELARSQMPVVRQYNVGLSWDSLRHLVLSDKAAVVAALNVAEYLDHHSKQGQSQLFSMFDGGAGTADFAVRFAAQDSSMQSILSHHQHEMEQSIEKHWQEVLRKQQLAAQLRTEISHLNTQIAELAARLRSLEAEHADLVRQLKQVKIDRRHHKSLSVSSLLELRAEYDILQAELTSQQSAVNSRVVTLRSQKKRLELQLTTASRQLTAAEQAPADVIQPVPRDAQKAQQWVFWLHMPCVLSALADITYTAQQLLLPTPCSTEVKSATRVTDLVTSLAQHYNAHQKCSFNTPALQQTGTNGLVKAYSKSEVPAADTIGPRHIDNFSSKQQGIWYPDKLVPVMYWSGTGTAADRAAGYPPVFNPFAAVNAEMVAESFTERLPPDYGTLQWAMLQLGSRAATPAERGNLGIARQNEQPSWLSKPGYLEFTALRSYPLMQLRQLCVALREQNLPWGHPAVVTLVKQTVYQLGEMVCVSSSEAGDISSSSGNSSSLPVSGVSSRYTLTSQDSQQTCSTDQSLKAASSSGSVMLLWRTHWEAEGGVLQALACELQLLAHKLADAPREHDAVLLLGQLAAYLADWHPDCKAVRRDFAAMTSNAADQLESQVLQALIQNQDSAARQLQAKQCKARAVSLLCYAAGPLQASDIGQMLQLMVQVKQGAVCIADAVSAGQLTVQCHDVMARRLPDILAGLHPAASHSAAIGRGNELAPDGSALLTAAVATVLQWAPAALSWVQVTGLSSKAYAAFQAQGEDGHLYSINVLDGTVLLDGAPPSRLPCDMLAHHLYKRTFGDSNFEVGASAAGTYKTLRAIKGCYYSFSWVGCQTNSAGGSGSRELVIEEIEQSTSFKLQLLDVDSDGSCGTWGTELPVRLKQMHSHWINRDQQVIVLRPVNFQHRTIDFLIKYGVSSSAEPFAAAAPGAGPLQCWRVPHHLRAQHWSALLEAFKQQQATWQLVLLAKSKHLDLLSKFENVSYIHTYAMEAVSSPAAESNNSISNSANTTVSSGSCSSGTSSSSSQSKNKAPAAVLLFELPRLGLEFELLSSGTVVSKAHSGYSLSRCQLLVTKLSPNLVPGSHASMMALESDANPTVSLQPATPGTTADSISAPDSHSGHVPKSKCVQLQKSPIHYTLPGFWQYLVLVKHGCSSVGNMPDGFGDKLLLVPAGQVVKAADTSSGTGGYSPSTYVKVSKRVDATLQAHTYQVHSRFGHIRASEVLPRLQLAALYAATSSLLPEPSSRMTGAQTAMQLIRQSWVNRPLTEKEVQHLTAAARYAGHLAPALPLQVAELMSSACQLRHLHVATAAYSPDSSSQSPTTTASGPPVLDPDAASKYKSQAVAVQPGGWLLHHKLRASTDTEARCLGTSSLGMRASKPPWRRLQQYKAIDSLVPGSPVCCSCVAESEQRLKCLVTSRGMQEDTNTSKPVDHHHQRSDNNGRSCSSHSSYPLSPNQGSNSTPLEVLMHQELERSWQAHHRSKNACSVHPNTRTTILSIQADVLLKRKQTQQYLLHHLWHIPPEVGPPAASFRLLRASSAVPDASLLDLLCCAWQPELMLEFNPFLSTAALSRLHEGVLTWLQLCVLEDKLARLVQYAEAGAEAEAMLKQELLVHRTWDVTQHPKWLVFEVEGQLQIRPAQYDIAQHLLTHPGAIVQLNMGEGKTRVILPMLALQWIGDRKHVARLNFLSTLLHEAYSHLHQHLTASVLDVKLLQLPFHRDVVLTKQTARAMRAAVSHCQRVGGLLLVVPEHRLSLELKWHELRLRGDAASLEVCEELQALAAMPYLDMLDESDELLHHRFQLVYACGTREALYGRPERVSALQAVLLAVTQLTDGEATGFPELHHSGVAVWPTADTRPHGSFCAVRLLDGDALKAVLPDMLKRVAEAVLALPTYELRWLNALQEGVLRFITDQGADLQQLHEALPTLTADQTDQLLALRGILALGMLHHCLMKRHNVDYGINRSPNARKKLAVPFRAAHTPSERSEFAQPDVALLLTHLSYYADGLNLEQFTEGLEELQRMGKNAQHDYYSSWLALLSKQNIPADALASFDDVSKVDPTNSQQLVTLWRLMGQNMATINFWLSFCLLPHQTSQYPQKLTCNAWNLADNSSGSVYGFSGTNDNHRLLPLQVQQADMNDKPLLAATNGRMLDTMLQTASYETLQWQQDQQGGSLQWQALLDYALRHNLHALLDCGALLASTTNRKAAQYLRQQMQHSANSIYQGVCYFDTDQHHWMIDDVQGRSLPRHTSPIAERDAFVIFDEARCRGADLKLQQQAMGLLTLAPGVCKDKLMQAAGRMRQLGRGQTLRIVGLSDVRDKIIAANTQLGRSSSCVSMVHVLQWVMSNTVEATLHGVTQWAAQGLHFAVTHNAPNRALQQDMLLPKDLYGSSRACRPVADVVSDMIKQQLLLISDSKVTMAVESTVDCPAENVRVDRGIAAAVLGHGQQQLLLQIQHNAGTFGAGHCITAGTAVDQECERELEREEEEELEQQIEVARATPAAEQDWDYACVAKYGSLHSISKHCRLFRMQDVLLMTQPESIRHIVWSPRVFVTSNYIWATASAQWAYNVNAVRPGSLAAAVVTSGVHTTSIGEYLRPVSNLLLLPCGGVILLSEREAEGILEQLYVNARSQHSAPADAATNKPADLPQGAHLLSLCYIRLAKHCSNLSSTRSSSTGLKQGVQLLAIPLSKSPCNRSSSNMFWQQLPAIPELVSVHLFNGGAMYDGDQQQLSHLKMMVQGRTEAVEALLDIRGKHALFPRSQLELACDVL